MSSHILLRTPPFASLAFRNVPLIHRQAVQQQVRFATKKAGGSSANGRDSAGRRLGVKIYHNMEAKAGSIIIRQRGKKVLAGENCGMGKDHTLFAKINGVVRFSNLTTKNNKTKKVVHIDP